LGEQSSLKVINKILQIEQNEIKNFYEEIKYFKQPQIILPTSCKDSRGNVILQIEDVLKRWKEYFCNILKPPTISYFIVNWLFYEF
jgi:hypothetical protein